MIKNFGLEIQFLSARSATRFRYALFNIPCGAFLRVLSSSFIVLFGWLCEISLSLLFARNETKKQQKNNKIKKNVDSLLLRVFLCWVVHIVVVVVVVFQKRHDEGWSEEQVYEIVDIVNFFLPRRRTRQIDFDYENDELANGRRRRRELREGRFGTKATTTTAAKTDEFGWSRFNIII